MLSVLLFLKNIEEDVEDFDASAVNVLLPKVYKIFMQKLALKLFQLAHKNISLVISRFLFKSNNIHLFVSC